MINRFGVAALLLASVIVGCGGDPAPKPGVFLDFESKSDLSALVWMCRVGYSLSDEYSSSGKNSLRCDFPDVRYPGVNFLEFPRNIAALRKITMDVYNPGVDTLFLVTRIDDDDSGEEYSNRFNRTHPIPPGESTVTMNMSDVRHAPATRELDLTRISRFLFFLAEPGKRTTLYIDTISFK